MFLQGLFPFFNVEVLGTSLFRSCMISEQDGDQGFDGLRTDSDRETILTVSLMSDRLLPGIGIFSGCLGPSDVLEDKSDLGL